MRDCSRNSQSKIEERTIMEIRDLNAGNKLDVNKIEKMKIKQLRKQLSKLHLSTTFKYVRKRNQIKTVYRE